jgi:glycosyltransferase involved in cell wall biosynthesis
MNIVIAGQNSATEYSGGRYHAWMMAEALAHIGYKVNFWTNNIPIFQNDFTLYPSHHSIKVIKSHEFNEEPSVKPDIVILVPHNGRDDFYYKVILFAKKNRARLVLLNFETPNWYNSLSPEHRDESLWDGWVETSYYADLILSSAIESDKYARLFYKKIPSGAIFRHCYPSINSLVADRIQADQTNKQIIVITRFLKGQRHKGGFDLIDSLCRAMKGYTLSILVGSGTVDSSFKEDLLKKSDLLDINIRFLYKLNDWDKFREIKRSSLMLFLSYFEGFGLPPIESQYCDVPCIAYDLPVLREVSGKGLIYVKPSDKDQLKLAIENVLTRKYYPPFSLKKQIARVCQIDSYANRLESIIREVASLTSAPGVESISKTKVAAWKKEMAKNLFSIKLQDVKHMFARFGEKIKVSFR